MNRSLAVLLVLGSACTSKSNDAANHDASTQPDASAQLDAGNSKPVDAGHDAAQPQHDAGHVTPDAGQPETDAHVPMAFACPSGPFGAPVPDGASVTRVPGIPIVDDFNMQGQQYTNVEGAVWWQGALYVSEIQGNVDNPPPSRVLKLSADGQVSVFLPDSGSNGLAIDIMDRLIGGVHKDGSVSILAPGVITPIVSSYDGKRFDSPNDLTVRSDGNIYFSDPSWQAPSNTPQAKTRVYRIDPQGALSVVDDSLDQPNGITLSPDGNTLYISGGQLKKYPVNADGSVGAGSDFISNGSGDGMVVDCAGNLYVTHDPGVIVYDAGGHELKRITVPDLTSTNVAFGGADHKTLFITGMGSGGNQGVFKVQLNIPGFPY